MPSPAAQRPDRNLAMELVRVTESAALAAARWVGRADKEGADGAAVDAMRLSLSSVQMDGVVVIGEGEKDEAPMLYNGEQIGDGTRRRSTSPSTRWRAQRSRRLDGATRCR